MRTLSVEELEIESKKNPNFSYEKTLGEDHYTSVISGERVIIPLREWIDRMGYVG